MPDVEDNCVSMLNPQQSDTDGDGKGDACDEDMDGDSVNNNVDNCPYVANAGQSDTDRRLSQKHNFYDCKLILVLIFLISTKVFVWLFKNIFLALTAMM